MELAKKVGISRNWLITVEHGKGDVTVTKLKAIADFFGKTLNWFVR